jgi:hypothetical protein
MVLKEGFADMLKIICTILSRPESEAFKDPVDWKVLELYDYPEIVKSEWELMTFILAILINTAARLFLPFVCDCLDPMDLGTVKKGIESGKYETIEVNFI